VGNNGSDTLVESWSGTAWSVVPSPTPGTYGGLSGVSCTSPRSCTAVGSYSHGTGSGSSGLSRALVESWDGTVWSVVLVPSPVVAHLYGVSCGPAKSCQGVGDYVASSGLSRALVESWDGTAWSAVPAPRFDVAYLYGVSCASPRSCKAVGDYVGRDGLSRALVESWDGTAWSVEPA
jgi:hypothetical protein